MDVKFKKEPAIEVVARVDGNNKIIHIGEQGMKLIKNEDLYDGELILLKMYKVDYTKK